MAVTAATLTGDFSGFLSPAMAGPIFDDAAKLSTVQRLVRQVPLGANGATVPVVTGTIDAGWVSEGGQKPADSTSLGLVTITPKKLATIAVVSAEVVRANPGNYMTLLQGQMSESFARAFDRAVLHDEGPTGTAGAGPFATFIDQTTNSVEVGTGTTIHNDFTAALALLIADGSRLTGWALAEALEVNLLNAQDTTNRPLYIDAVTDGLDESSIDSWLRRTQILGRPAYIGPNVATANGTSVVGYGGDWSKAAWGVVGGISFDVSTEATVTINGALTSLWEYNLVAIRAEAEYGFVVADVDSFVKLTNAV